MNDTEYNILKKLIVFCILMETNNGILNKSPSYIMEKYIAVFDRDTDKLESLLDPKNKRIYRKYIRTWIGE